MKRAVVRSVIRSPVDRLDRHRMGHRLVATADRNIATAAGFTDARTQQESGKERHNGDSSVPR
jgi:alpha-D-ribose 1-methylphosphonate 5-triphosphate synthase subunit PhnG